MALPLRSQINVKVASESINSLAKGIEKTQKTANSISQTLLKKNKFRREAIAQDKISFFNRRDAVRRREQESVIEAGSLQAASNRTRIPMGSAITESTKGFLGRILDFVGTIFVGWLLTNLPTIIATARNVIKRIQSIVDTLGKFVSDVGSIIFSFFDTLGSVASNIARFDFTDDSGEVRRSFEELEKAVGDLGTHFDDAVKLITTPLGEGPGEEQAPPIGTEYTTTTEGEQPQSSAPSGIIKPQGQTTQSQNLQKGDKVSGFSVTSGYGPRWGGTHKGVDVGTPVGTYVALSVPTEIVFAGLHGTPGRGYGNVVDAWAPSLGLQFRMAHLSSVKVKPGSKIDAGTVIGRTGGAQGDRGSGSSTGPHVHFEVDNRKGGTDYGGMGNPSSFAKFLSLSSKEPTKQQTQSQPQTPAVPSGGRTPSAPPAPSGSSAAGPWKPLLDVISKAESTQNGYNAIAPGDYNPNLSRMTIAEANKARGVKGGAGAIGRYQLTNPIGQAARANLKPTDLFSPENQDKIAIALIQGRGVTLEMIKNNPGEASVRLGAEWAGLPLLKVAGPYARKVGDSYYQGYNGNRATIKVSDLQKAFAAMGAPQQAQVAAQPSTPAAEVSAPLTREQALAVAQVSQPPTNAPNQMQALTPERMGNQVVVAPQQLAPQVSQQAPMAGKQYSISEPQNLLNKFMLTRLLLDLAYT